MVNRMHFTLMFWEINYVKNQSVYRGKVDSEVSATNMLVHLCMVKQNCKICGGEKLIYLSLRILFIISCLDGLET